MKCHGQDYNAGENEIFNQADKHANECTYEQAALGAFILFRLDVFRQICSLFHDYFAAAEQSKSPLTKPTTVANTIQGQEAWSNASEMAGHSMSLLKTNAEGKISQVIEGFSTDEDG